MSKAKTANRSFFEKLADTIVGGRWIILIITAALLVFCCFSAFWVDVEDDITLYLQDSAEAKKGITIMNEEFVTYATARVMVENVSREEANALYDGISTLDGVILVDYADDAQHYKDRSALYSVTFTGTGQDESAKEGMAKLTELLEPYETTVYSDAFSTLSDIIVTEMLGVLVIVVFVVLGVLIFTTSSYGEILVLLSTFVAAAILNMGTNFLLGTISFVSNAVAIVLQLALSVDYAIILCNRYKEERENYPIKKAVSVALARSIPSISASSLTTIAGLLAMTFMEFRLGVDMGVALIKSIVFSLLSVFLFMPVMLVLCGGLIERTAHKSFVPKVSFLGKFAYATRYIVPILFAGLVVLSYLGFSKSLYGYSMDNIETIHQNEMDIARHKIEDRFGKSNLLVAIIPSGDYENEAAFSEALLDCDEVKSILGIASIDAVKGYKLGDRVNYRQIMDVADIDETTAKALITYCAADRGEYRPVADDLEGYSLPLVDMFLILHEGVVNGSFEGEFALADEQEQMVFDLYDQLHMAQEQLQGENYSRILIYIDLPDQGEDTFHFLDRIHSIGEQYFDGGVILTGNSVAAKDFNDTFEKDNRTVSALSIVLVMIILFFTFKSVGMPILLILVIQGSIWLNFAIPAWRGEYVFFMCFLIVTAIQMGANIDYAIVISSRYTELRGQNMPQREAMIETLNLAFPTVITSGLMMVVAGLVIGVRVSQGVIAGMGMYVGIGTSISILFVNLALPQILIFGDGFARATTIRFSEKLFGKNVKRAWRVITAYCVTLTSIFMLITAPMSAWNAQKQIRAEKKHCEELSVLADGLHDTAVELRELEEANSQLNIDFAEHLLTDAIGTEQLNDGLAQYNEGAATLAEYKEIFREGEKQYKEGREEYEKGLAEYEAGKLTAAEGQAQYDEAYALYEEGLAQLAEGQAQYDAGLAEYEAGKAQLAMGQALLAVVQPLYLVVMPLYNDYLTLQGQYDEMEAAGASEFELGLMRLRVDAAKTLFETKLVGPSIGELMQQMEEAQQEIAEGQAQLAAAEIQLAEGRAELDAGYAQIADAEAQLAAGRQELDAGYAKLADAEAQLAAGKEELDAGKAELDDGAKQIADGEDELAAAEKEIEAGRETLAENREKLDSDIDTLDRIDADRKKLDEGLKMLTVEKEVSARMGEDSDAAEICTTASAYFNDRIRELSVQSGLVYVVASILIAAAIAAAAALLLWLADKTKAGSVCAVVAMLAAFAGAILWRMGCGEYGGLPFPAGLLLTAAAALAADRMMRKQKYA